MTLIYDFDKWGTYTCCFKKCCFSLTNSDSDPEEDAWLEKEAKKRRAWFKKKYFKEDNRDCINKYFDAIDEDRSAKKKENEEAKQDGDIEAGKKPSKTAGTCC